MKTKRKCKCYHQQKLLPQSIHSTWRYFDLSKQSGIHDDPNSQKWSSQGQVPVTTDISISHHIGKVLSLGKPKDIGPTSQNIHLDILPPLHSLSLCLVCMFLDAQKHMYVWVPYMCVHVGNYGKLQVFYLRHQLNLCFRQSLSMA